MLGASLIIIVSIKVHQKRCAPEESCEDGTEDTEPTADEPIEADAEPTETDAEQIETNAEQIEADGEEPAIEEPPAPPLEWYLGVSENLKVSQRLGVSRICLTA